MLQSGAPDLLNTSKTNLLIKGPVAKTPIRGKSEHQSSEGIAESIHQKRN